MMNGTHTCIVLGKMRINGFVETCISRMICVLVASAQDNLLEANKVRRFSKKRK